MSRSVLILVILLTSYADGIVMADASIGATFSAKGNGQGRYAHITTDVSVHHIVEHPAFKGFSQLMLPREYDTHSLDTPLRNVRSLMGITECNPCPFHWLGHEAIDSIYNTICKNGGCCYGRLCKKFQYNKPHHTIF